MKQEEKQLLLVDLSARLPYGVKMNHIADDKNQPITLIGIAKDMITLQSSCGYSTANVEDYEPYLFPLSSMTEEQKQEYHNLCIEEERRENKENLMKWVTRVYYHNTIESIDWLNAHHFDYRNLISKNLAIDCTNLNIY